MPSAFYRHTGNNAVPFFLGLCRIQYRPAYLIQFILIMMALIIDIRSVPELFLILFFCITDQVIVKIIGPHHGIIFIQQVFADTHLQRTHQHDIFCL